MGQGSSAAVVPFVNTNVPPPELVERACILSAFDTPEVLWLWQQYCRLDTDEDGVLSCEELLELPALKHQPLRERLPYALGLNTTKQYDFPAFVAALSPFNPRSSLDDKTRLLFRLYDSDQDGRITKKDLRSTMKLVLKSGGEDTLSEEQFEECLDLTLTELGLPTDEPADEKQAEKDKVALGDIGAPSEAEQETAVGEIEVSRRGSSLQAGITYEMFAGCVGTTNLGPKLSFFIT
ncbi:unnamed protein product [Vitrella brassicaformis CCMP3155]|uniref:EF-hand domain-containing protein n=1 Tax=Vitrella brassicaformis (strain CCMP3155) TaxID=1169540 RepID=A0A0G4EKU5_VITBC|nr:unnamed protein product [Vitrella brassicaformis CCMP3155]|eukprot:CEL97282.1 unnamed protein product [Vitrella brassicaformis CCMP3155]